MAARARAGSIVTDSAQARDVIEQGKLAVVLGVETSEPLRGKQIPDVPQCDRKDIDAGLDELYALGVRSMFLSHKFDNALCGVRFDSGTLDGHQRRPVPVDRLPSGRPRSAPACSTTTRSARPQAPGAEAKLPAGVRVPRVRRRRGCNVRGPTDLLDM
ncbi:membrane dipeptidase [Streptomyces tricolor]|nr:membrane dipeptidase [Streptomyces tricolor]